MDRSTCLFGLILYTNFGDIRIIFVFYLVVNAGRAINFHISLNMPVYSHGLEICFLSKWQ